MTVNPDKLIDDIYEASFIPELWPDVMHRISLRHGIVGGVLYCTTRHGVKWLASADIIDAMTKFVEQDWISRDTRPHRAIAKRYSGFVTEMDLYSREELSASQVHVEYLRPAGLGWSAGTVIFTPHADLITFGFEQKYDKGPIGRETLSGLDLYRPHLARAALTSARIAFERARGIASTFERIGLPCAILTGGGRVVCMNAGFEALKEQVRLLSFDRLAFSDPGANSLYEEGIIQCGRNHRAVLSLALPRSEEAPPAVAHLIPINGQVHDVFARGDVVLLITPLTNPSMPRADIIAALYDLSPAEARVARLICDGQTAEAIGHSLSLSPETIRTQTKAVLAKVGVRRQIELVRLLALGNLPRQREGKD